MRLLFFLMPLKRIWGSNVFHFLYLRTGKMRKKLLLINPSSTVTETLSSGKSTRFPPLGLLCIAAAVPENWDVELIDENTERFRLKEADLVGITSMTFTAPRAYAIAEQYKKKGIPVVIGGIHASFMPEEAMTFADSIVIGEGESVFPELIRDFENRKLKRTYRGVRVALKELKPPRRDILSSDYLMDSVQTSRGCPYGCNFCSVTAFNGRTYRMREIEDVKNEIRGLKKKLLFFVDDNIIGVSERAIKLFKELRHLGKYWIAQSTVEIADNPEMVKAAYESGCRVLYIGFESISSASLKGMNKKSNLKKGINYYKRAIKVLHEQGIAVWGSFIFGNDGETKEVFYRTLDFISTSAIDMVTLPVLTPLPGTLLYETLKKDNRLLYTNYPSDWPQYSFTNVVFKPQYMSPEDLDMGITDIASHIYTGLRPERQLIKTRLYKGSLSTSLISYAMMRSFSTMGKKIIKAKKREYNNQGAEQYI
jgi:radical SAM superfamily enzyme YgiQ (UPF0313 family)